MQIGSYYDFAVSRCFTYGAGVLWQIKRLTLGLGKRYMIFTGCGPKTEYVVNAITQSLTSPADAFRRDQINPYGHRMPLRCSLPVEDADHVELEYRFVDIDGQQVTLTNIEKAADLIAAYQPDVLVAVGGGKVLDIVRGATYYGDVYSRPNLILCPTLVAANPAASQLSVIYNETGTDIISLWSLAYPEEAVILDTEIAVEAPAYTLVAAVGDTMGTIYETLHTWFLQRTEDKIDPLSVSFWKAHKSVLMKYARKACKDMETHTLTPEVEWVMAATSRLSGPQRTSISLFLAHVLDEVLVGFEPVSKMLHGMIVGFGSLVQCVYVNKMDDFYELLDLYRDIGVPCTLAQMGIPHVTYEALLEKCIACSDKIMMAMSKEPIDPEKTAKAVLAEDELARAYLANGI